MVLVAAYGVLIAGLDTIALILLYALTTLLANQPRTGITASILGHGKLSADERYNEALILLLVTAGLFVLRSGLSVFGLWLTIGAANAAQANLVSRLLVGHARASHLTRLDRNSSETLRTVSMSIDQVVNGIVGSSVTLVSNTAVMVAVLLGPRACEPARRSHRHRLLRCARTALGTGRARDPGATWTGRPGTARGALPPDPAGNLGGEGAAAPRPRVLLR